MLTAVFGRRGSGKTTLIRAMIPQLKKPVVILDVLGNFQGYEHENKEWLDATSLAEALQGIKDYCEKPEEHSGVITLQTGDLDNSVDFLCSALWKIHGGTLVLDEIDAISIAEAPCFDEAIRYGRNHGIDMVTGCRRPAEVSKNITAAADRVYVFVTREPRDIEYYCEFLGDDLALQIPRLPPYHGVWADFIQQNQGLFKTDENGKITILKTTSQSQEISPQSEPDEGD